MDWESWYISWNKTQDMFQHKEASCTNKLSKNLFYIVSCGCRSLWGGPRAAASNSSTPVRQAGAEALQRGMGQAHPHGFMPLDGWLAAACSALRHQLCPNLPSHLLYRHPNVSKWVLMVKVIEGGWGTTGCWTEVLVQKRETEKVMVTLSVTYSLHHFSNSTWGLRGKFPLEINATISYLLHHIQWCSGFQTVGKSTCTCSFWAFFTWKMSVWWHFFAAFPLALLVHSPLMLSSWTLLFELLEASSTFITIQAINKY